MKPYSQSTRRHVTSCGAVVWKLVDDRVQLLLIKQFGRNDAWGVPKGHIEDEESFEECALREVKEETGLDVTLGSRLPDAVISTRNTYKRVVLFMAVPVDSSKPVAEFDPDNEITDVKWFNIDELPKTFDYLTDTFARVIEALKCAGGRYDDI
jgi:8-oxo-dGTP pyrophosphatase MutT (NUDIX family)